ncbi:MAG: hypothetical protein KC466_06590 [Myxococcales bacterium]|nr:hypothetical protein [Myxococcales bacterium]
MAYQCPACQGPVYNRRRAACEHCGAAIPEEMRLSAEQIARLTEVQEEEAKRHKASMETLRVPARGGVGGTEAWFDFGADGGCDGGDCGG